MCVSALSLSLSLSLSLFFSLFSLLRSRTDQIASVVIFLTCSLPSLNTPWETRGLRVRLSPFFFRKREKIKKKSSDFHTVFLFFFCRRERQREDREERRDPNSEDKQREESARTCRNISALGRAVPGSFPRFLLNDNNRKVVTASTSTRPKLENRKPNAL